MIKKLHCILLVDDNECDNFYHTVILKESNIVDAIQVAQSGDEALKYLEEKTPIPELIFLDINMPGMDGWDFLRKYALLPPNKKAKAVVMLTTSTNPVDKNKTQKFKMIKGFENKPLTVEMAQKIMERLFQASTLSRNGRLNSIDPGS